MQKTTVPLPPSFYLQMKSLLSLISVPHSEQAVEASEDVSYQITHQGFWKYQVLTLRRTEEPVLRFSSLPFPALSPGWLFGALSVEGLPETVSFSEKDSSSGNMQRRAEFFSPGSKKKKLWKLLGCWVARDKKQNWNTLKENHKPLTHFFWTLTPPNPHFLSSSYNSVVPLNTSDGQMVTSSTSKMPLG